MNATRFCPAAPHETCILLHSFPRPYPITSYPSTRITNPSPASTAHTKPSYQTSYMARLHQSALADRAVIRNHRLLETKRQPYQAIPTAT